MNHTFLKEGVELLPYTHNQYGMEHSTLDCRILWNGNETTPRTDKDGLPHTLPSPCCLQSGVKGVSKTNQLISCSNMALLSRSSAAVKYSSVCVIWMWAWSRSRQEVVT